MVYICNLNHPVFRKTAAINLVYRNYIVRIDAALGISPFSDKPLPSFSAKKKKLIYIYYYMITYKTFCSHDALI